MPPATRCTWKARTSSRSRHSGERPKKRPNLATACTYDRCVAGDRLRTVMSSIMRRRRGLKSAISKLLSEGWVATPTSSQAGGTSRDRRDHAAAAASFNPRPSHVFRDWVLVAGGLRRRPVHHREQEAADG